MLWYGISKKVKKNANYQSVIVDAKRHNSSESVNGGWVRSQAMVVQSRGSNTKQQTKVCIKINLSVEKTSCRKERRRKKRLQKKKKIDKETITMLVTRVKRPQGNRVMSEGSACRVPKPIAEIVSSEYSVSSSAIADSIVSYSYYRDLYNFIFIVLYSYYNFIDLLLQYLYIKIHKRTVKYSREKDNTSS